MSTFDIETDSLDEVAVRLERYLSYANTRSGRAADFAREDLNARLDQHKAREGIPRAWAHLVEGDLDERLATLLTEAAASLTEDSPARRDVADFLRRLRPDDGRRPRKPTGAGATVSTKPSPGLKAVRAYDEAVKSRAPSAIVDAAKAKMRASAARLEGPFPPPRRDQTSLRYWLLGEERFARSAREAYVAVFAALAERDPGFLERVAPILRKSKNRGVARTKQELSSNESMVNSGVPLPGNWWLLTKMRNDGKIRSLRIACDAAEIRFGDRAGLDISLPNA